MIAAILLFATPLAAQETGKKVAIFDFELVDTSLDGEMLGTTDAEFSRLAMIGDRLRAYYDEHADFTIIGAPEVATEGRKHNLQSCGQCDVKIAREAGADLAVTGVVQKVSNLILSLTIYVRDTESGEIVQMAGTDIRGNTDESWGHGLRWMAKNRLHLIPAK
ncbi:DUF3280 domain-containing protein [Methylobrevis sp. L22]|uniref:DUF3280 domain-containing protein n=1 Tax=Methylobrevis albus TaxID=2793297 RepID=A0A931MYS2_9HYPH|nr:DUF3280 domain-containing protein [Methylobrevis albus]